MGKSNEVVVNELAAKLLDSAALRAEVTSVAKKERRQSESSKEYQQWKKGVNLLARRLKCSREEALQAVIVRAWHKSETQKALARRRRPK